MVMQATEDGTLADGTARPFWFTRRRNLLLNRLARSLTLEE
jgi:hypothetical protein